MKRNLWVYTVVSIFSILFIASSCSEDDGGDPANSLKADAGPDQTVAPLTTVTLDGSASTGPAGAVLNYEWSLISGQSGISLSSSNTANPTFTPTKNGTYTFALRLTNNSQFSVDQTTVTVAGALELSGTLTENMSLKDIDSDPSMPDYVITSDLIIPAGFNLNFDDPGNASGNVVVKVAAGAGIIVQDDGAFHISTSSNHKITSDTGWKGILVDGGTIDIKVLTTIENAGASPFEGQTEAASIVFTGNTPSITNLSSVIFVNSGSYDILATTFTSGAEAIISNSSFSSSIPIKSPVAFTNLLGFNTYPTDYDYIHLQPSGGSTIDALSGQSFKLRNGAKYYLDEDFLAGSPVIIQGSTIYMKEGAGILAQDQLTIQESDLDGLNGAAWKGIAYAGNNQLSITNTTISNAGSDVFSTGFFSTPVKAALYISQAVTGLSGVEINDSGGYGVYNASMNTSVTASGCTFSGTAQPAIRTHVFYVPTIASNTYTMSDGVAAVEVFVPNINASPGSTWSPLGGSNYYLMSGSVRLSGGSWILLPGVNIRFKSGKQLDLEQGQFTAIGSGLLPITFDGESGTSGSWAGILVQTTAKIEHCQIKNGGETAIIKNGVTPATEIANLVFNQTVASSSTFKNNTISGSAGYGLLVEAGKQNPDALNVANNNTFSNNISGDAIVK
ncbi:MAG: PKD domain-containing protein [Cyclobacteriaceae bacterium]